VENLKSCTITVVIHPEEGDTRESFDAFICDVVSEIKMSTDRNCLVEIDLRTRLMQAGIEEGAAAKRLTSTPVRDPEYPARSKEWDAACARYTALAKIATLV